MRICTALGTGDGEANASLLFCPPLRGRDEELADASAACGAGGDERSDVGDRAGSVERNVTREAHESERLVVLISGHEDSTVIGEDGSKSRCDVVRFGRMLELREKPGDRCGIGCAGLAY